MWQFLFSFQMFLAQNGYCHSDLSIRNVVLGDKLLTKLTNFGIKRTGRYYSQFGRYDYLQDMAPETMDSDEFSAASDVYVLRKYTYLYFII